MSGPTLVGFGVSDVFAPADTVRVTFGQRHPIIELDSQFYNDFAKVYAQLTIPTSKQDKFWTLNANSAAPGLTTAVQDLRLFQSLTGSQLLAVLDDTCGDWVMATRVEKLSGPDAEASTTSDGAAARSQLAATTQGATDAAPSIFGSIGSGIEKYLGAVKWIGIGAAVLALAWFATTTEKEL